MSISVKRWTVQDRYGNVEYLTQERWEYMIDEQRTDLFLR